VDDPETAAKELVDAGIWEKTPDGYLIVDYLRDQEAASLVEERAEVKRQYDREFQRDRYKATRAGMRVDEWRTAQAKAAGVSVSQWLAEQRGTLVRVSDENRNSRPVPSRPVPTRKGRDGEEERGSDSPGGSSDPARVKNQWPRQLDDLDDEPYVDLGPDFKLCDKCGNVHFDGGPCRCGMCGSVMAVGRTGAPFTEVDGRKLCQKCAGGPDDQ
jgi:hypothetical protein